VREVKEHRAGQGRRSKSRPCGKMPPGLSLSRLLVMWCVMLSLPPCLNCLRCYVCGGNSGTPCKGPEMEQSSSLIGIQDPVQECNDLINNRGCVKQYVNGVVLLRGCWLDGTNKCLRNGAAEVCTCSKDLCNSSRPLASSTALLFFILLMSLHNSLSSAS